MSPPGSEVFVDGSVVVVASPLAAEVTVVAGRLSVVSSGFSVVVVTCSSAVVTPDVDVPNVELTGFSLAASGQRDRFASSTRNKDH